MRAGNLKRVDMIPYTIVPGEVARHRHDVFLERAIVQERVRLALGMSLQARWRADARQRRYPGGGRGRRQIF